VQLARWIVGMKLRWHDGADEVPTGCARHAGELMRAEYERWRKVT
jgi:hypothetical protein